MSGRAVKPGSVAVAVSRRLGKAITELKAIQKLLLSGEGLDDRILADFRDAVSRVRNTAWSAQQYAALKATNQDPTNVMSVLAAERVRTAFQLLQAIEGDLANKDVKFQAGQLVQLQQAVEALGDQLRKAVGKME